VGPDHSLTGFGAGVPSRAAGGCGERSLPGLPLVPSLYSSLCPVQLSLLALGRLLWKKRVASSIRSPNTWEMAGGLQDTTEGRAGKGILEESFDGPFGLLSRLAGPLQLAGLASSVWAGRSGLRRVPCAWDVSQHSSVRCASVLGRAGSSAVGGGGASIPALSQSPVLHG